MKIPFSFLFIALSVAVAFAAENTLLFSDDFEREESTPDKEELGKGWTTNSPWRAQGKKQVDLLDGTMRIVRVPEADHGVAIFHDVEFQDGAVELRFKLQEGEGFGVDFVDRECKTIHAGHLCIARVSLKQIALEDSKTGNMDLKIRDARKANALTEAQKALIKSKRKVFPVDLEADEWHQMLVVVEGDTMSISIDDELVGEFSSEGIAHPTKRMITLAVGKSATLDDLKIWRLK